MGAEDYRITHRLRSGATPSARTSQRRCGMLSCLVRRAPFLRGVHSLASKLPALPRLTVAPRVVALVRNSADSFEESRLAADRST